MERTITYKITDSGQNIRIDSFLRKHGYSMQNLTLLKKMPESILKNGEWSYMQTTLQAGDILTVRIQEETSSPNIPAVNLPIDIVYEDEDIIVINKAAGMPIHPSLNNYRNSLANALMWYYEQQNKPFIFRCTNRLDRDTSGLTVVAKHMVSSNILSSMTARHQIEREYLAIVRGHVTPFEGTINAPIGRTGSSLIERKIDFENGEHAITHYHTVFEKNRAFTRFSYFRNRPHTSDPSPYETPRISFDRRLSVQSGYGTDRPAGASLSLSSLSPSDNRKTNDIYRRSARRHGKIVCLRTP